jgi:hypothetical protein
MACVSRAKGTSNDHRYRDYGTGPLGLVPRGIRQRLHRLIVSGTGAMTAAEISILVWAIPSLIVVPILLRLRGGGDERGRENRY